MTLDIVKEKNKTLRYTLTFIFLFVFILLYYSLPESKIVFPLLVMVNLISITFSLDMLKYSKIGLCEILDDKILIDISGKEKKYNFNELSHLLVDHNYFYPNHYFVKTNNDLKITLQKPDEEISFKVLITKRKEKLKFKNVLEKLYSSGINQIRENDINGTRSFLFKSNLSYNEIQDVKQKYNLSWY